MKPPEIESRLWHIAGACEKVLRVTAGKTLEEYAADDLLPDAVERQLMIIGEAVGRIAQLEPAIAAQLGDYPRIVAFRNQLVHNYPHIDHAAVWSIIQREVPVLLERVRSLPLARPLHNPVQIAPWRSGSASSSSTTTRMICR